MCHGVVSAVNNLVFGLWTLCNWSVEDMGNTALSLPVNSATPAHHTAMKSLFFDL
jgi:hypothetical protein